MKKLILAALLSFLCLFTSCDKLFIPGNVPDTPPVLTISAEAGERTAEPLSYYWEKMKTEEKTELEGADPLTAAYDPFIVQPGEEIRFTFADENEPYIMNVSFCQADGGGGFLEAVTLSCAEEDKFLYSAPEEDGILIVNAIWPVWVNSGIRAEVTYAFYIWSAKG